jgi:hypothetical protein
MNESNNSQLLALRRKHVEGGGKLLTLDEIAAEVRALRGGVRDD